MSKAAFAWYVILIHIPRTHDNGIWHALRFFNKSRKVFRKVLSVRVDSYYIVITF